MISIIMSIFNKESTIASILDSWLGRASGEHRIELVLVYDKPEDDSHAVAQATIAKYSYVAANHLPADDMYEVHCNMLGFQQSHGDIVVFVQDDNWMYTQDWDLTLVRTLQRVHNIGVVGLLAGASFYDALTWDRLEVETSHKEEVAGVPLEMGLWQCDAVCRPFAIRADLLTALRGLSLVYCPLDFDDLDLCVRALKRDLNNVLIPFDVVNTMAGKQTLERAWKEQVYERSFWRFRQMHAPFLDSRGWVGPVLLDKLAEEGGRLVYA